MVWFVVGGNTRSHLFISTWVTFCCMKFLQPHTEVWSKAETTEDTTAYVLQLDAAEHAWPHIQSVYLKDKQPLLCVIPCYLFLSKNVHSLAWKSSTTNDRKDVVLVLHILTYNIIPFLGYTYVTSKCVPFEVHAVGFHTLNECVRKNLP